MKGAFFHRFVFCVTGVRNLNPSNTDSSVGHGPIGEIICNKKILVSSSSSRPPTFSARQNLIYIFARRQIVCED